MPAPEDVVEYEPSVWEPVADHVAQYLATNGVEGGIWMDAPCIILTTVGARSGKLRRTPLIRVRHGDNYLVVASMGGAPDHPQWFHNLVTNPDVVINDLADVHHLRARVASPDEKAALWSEAAAVWPDYDAYQVGTDRDIPLVICEPR
jgi:deazaflavin-dependent oxidoreductase (nitroreductase family)